VQKLTSADDNSSYLTHTIALMRCNKRVIR